ncbi:MAG: hypothetical protein GY870_04815 [archaeon]|nr:hypothetical protein [archaeon]
MTNVFLSLIFGLISTFTLHLSKSMEKHGIEIFDQMRQKIGIDESLDENKGLKKPSIYIIGLIIHQTMPIWATLATGGKNVVYTSVFPIGMVITLLYSNKILKEKINRIQWIGSMIIIIGTVIIGIENIFRAELNENLQIGLSFNIIIIFSIICILGMVIAYRKNNPIVVGIIFGIVSGGIGCLDPVMKDIAQEVTGIGFLPTTPLGWVIYMMSFSMGGVGLIVTQWGFARDAKSSVLIPFFNSAYIIIPIIIYVIAQPGFDLTVITIIGIILTLIGIFFVGSKEDENKDKCKDKEVDTDKDKEED